MFVAVALGFYLGEWQGYLTKLSKLSRTTICLASRELRNSGSIIEVEDIQDRAVFESLPFITVPMNNNGTISVICKVQVKAAMS